MTCCIVLSFGLCNESVNKTGRCGAAAVVNRVRPQAVCCLAVTPAGSEAAACMLNCNWKQCLSETAKSLYCMELKSRSCSTYRCTTMGCCQRSLIQ